MADIERLTGNDGKLVTVTYGEEVTTGALLEQWYEVTAIAATSGFAAITVVGDLVWGDGITLVNSDKAKPLVEAEQADITSFNLEISKAEIDVTTMSDTVRRYRAGKTDMTGSLEGITTLGETDSAGWVLNNFLAVNRTAADGTITKSAIDSSPLYIKGVIQRDTSTAGEQEAFLWARVTILGTSLGAGGDDAQSFSSNFRVAPGNPDPTLYLRTIST